MAGRGGAGGGTAVRAVRHLGTAGAVTAVVVGAALALFGPGGELDPAAAQEPIAAASLDVLEEVVEVAPGGAAFAVAEDGALLDLGDVVRTDATGFAQVDFSDGSLARLDADATLEVVALDGDALAPEITVRVDVGRTWHRVQGVTGVDGTYEVETAVGTAAVRGTGFVVDCTDDATCTIRVFEGAVEVVTPDGQVIRIEAGESVTLRLEPDSTVTEVDRTGGTPEELRAGDEWVDRNVTLDEATGRFGPERQACAATLAGRNVAFADTPERAVELDVDDVADAVGAATAPIATWEVRLGLVGQEFTAYSGAVTGQRTRFEEQVEVREYAVFGVGLYEVAAVTTGVDCRLEAFVRITGRNPLTTVGGIAGAVLSLLGLALLSAAARGRRPRGARRIGGAVSGAVGGVGLAVLLQQFGAVPLTVASLGGLAGLGVLAGGVLPRPSPVAAPTPPTTTATEGDDDDQSV